MEEDFDLRIKRSELYPELFKKEQAQNQHQEVPDPIFDDIEMSHEGGVMPEQQFDDGNELSGSFEDNNTSQQKSKFNLPNLESRSLKEDPENPEPQREQIMSELFKPNFNFWKYLEPSKWRMRMFISSASNKTNKSHSRSRTN